MKMIFLSGVCLLVGFTSSFVHSRNTAVAPGEQIEVADVIRGKHFELVDAQGRVRIEMKMDDGNPVFNLKDENGKNRVVVFHQAKATGVYLNDDSGHTRVGLAQFPHGGGVAMHGEKGKGSAVYVLMKSRARLDVYDSDGKLTHRWPEQNEK